jgi:hypothetical protein
MKLHELHYLIEQLGLAEHGDKDVVYGSEDEQIGEIDGAFVVDTRTINPYVILIPKHSSRWSERFIPEHEK